MDHCSREGEVWLSGLEDWQLEPLLVNPYKESVQLTFAVLGSHTARLCLEFNFKPWESSLELCNCPCNVNLCSRVNINYKSLPQTFAWCFICTTDCPIGKSSPNFLLKRRNMICERTYPKRGKSLLKQLSLEWVITLKYLWYSNLLF